MPGKLILLKAGAATGNPVEWNGGYTEVTVSGTFGGASVAIQKLNELDGTWQDVDTTNLTFTTAGLKIFNCADGTFRAAVTGGAPSGLNCYFKTAPQGRL